MNTINIGKGFGGITLMAYEWSHGNIDQCDNSRVTLVYKDGSKHVFKKVRSIEQFRKEAKFKVLGERMVKNIHDGDIVEEGTLSYTVNIPRHHVDYYVVHSNDGFNKMERKMKVL